MRPRHGRSGRTVVEHLMTVITGATGHLGTVLCRLLSKQGADMRATLRGLPPPAYLADLSFDPARADLRDVDSLVEAFHGADLVYHTAGAVSVGLIGRSQLAEVNVQGTRNVIEACRETGVRRLVYISSVEALGLDGVSGTIDERVPFDPRKVFTPYGRSKAEATIAVQKANEPGLFETVILCPTGFVGPGDYRMSLMTGMIFDYMHRDLPAIVPGGFDFVDVRDVAQAATNAADRGEAGDVYILSGGYTTTAEIMSILEESTGMRGPILAVPMAVAKAFACISGGYSLLRRREPRFSPAVLRLLSADLRFSSAKARDRLDHRPRSIEESIRDTVEWLSRSSLIAGRG